MTKTQNNIVNCYGRHGYDFNLKNVDSRDGWKIMAVRLIGRGVVSVQKNTINSTDIKEDENYHSEDTDAGNTGYGKSAIYDMGNERPMSFYL